MLSSTHIHDYFTHHIEQMRSKATRNTAKRAAEFSLRLQEMKREMAEYYENEPGPVRNNCGRIRAKEIIPAQPEYAKELEKISREIKTVYLLDI